MHIEIIFTVHTDLKDQCSNIKHQINDWLDTHEVMVISIDIKLPCAFIVYQEISKIKPPANVIPFSAR